MFRALVVAAALVCAAPALAQPTDPQNTLLIDTTQGRIVIKLRNDLAPKHAERLKTLAREKFYDNVPFHRVIAGFMAQTGDGQNGNGTGGSKYPNLPAEFSKVSFKRGIVGMARRGDSNDSANSQFFIMNADGTFLDNKYTVVGEVVSGMDVVDKIYSGYGEGAPRGQGPEQGRIQMEGNAYLTKDFSRLDYIKKATIEQ